ncbi:MAG: class I SAM-dependent methyltransferase [Verrucomicrobia bacterium]|nr:class I SAM-dependent methyltransferase [Verrucomicrobiota bacterium]
MDVLGGWEEILAESCGENRIAYLDLIVQMWNVEVRTIAEIGVYKGFLSKCFRKYYPEAHLYLIDPWTIYDAYLEKEAGPVTEDQAQMDAAYRSVREAFEKDPHATIIKKFSTDAAHEVPDELDFVYIDGNHSYESIKEDILTWMPKVRAGGIISGHDYDPVDFPHVIDVVNEIFGRPPLVGCHTIWMWQKGS